MNDPKNATATPPLTGNPILPGYYADPTLVQYDGKAYLYATQDPWGGDTLGCWESDDFREWTYCSLQWPTKRDCTSPTSSGAKVWAPSVVRGADGRFFMYVSVGSEIWVGTAVHPLGPWQNPLGDRPLIPCDYYPGFHMIDAEAFLDEDGQAYLYWGSGHNWENGRCWAVLLGSDMASFDPAEVRDVTPGSTYFEAPFVVKRNGHYFLMYSNGVTIRDTYQVHYAVGETPRGPFIEAPNSPILVTDAARDIVSPGHHAIFTHEGQDYILYHRHSIPFDPDFIGRQICVDRITFTAEGRIEKVLPSHTGPSLIHGRRSPIRDGISAIATASSQASEVFGPNRVLDGNFATRWVASTEGHGAWLQLDLGEMQHFHRQELRLEYAWKPYHIRFESSTDGHFWQTIADFSEIPAQGSPIVITQAGSARYLRLCFPEDMPGKDISVFEWTVYET